MSSISEQTVCVKYKTQASEHTMQSRASCKGCGNRCSERVNVPCFTSDTYHRL